MELSCLIVVCHGAQGLPSDRSIAITTIFKGCELRNIYSAHYKSRDQHSEFTEF